MTLSCHPVQICDKPLGWQPEAEELSLEGKKRAEEEGVLSDCQGLTWVRRPVPQFFLLQIYLPPP